MRRESDQDAGEPVADILDRVAVPLRDVADVSLLQLLDPIAAVNDPMSHEPRPASSGPAQAN
jgi:hypothetical protein